MDPKHADTSDFVNVQEYLTAHPSLPPSVRLGNEIREVLKSSGCNLTQEQCETVAATHINEGKRKAGELLKTLGVSVKEEKEVWQGCNFSRWTIKGKVLFSGMP